MDDNQPPKNKPMKDDEAINDIERQDAGSSVGAGSGVPDLGQLRTKEDALEHYDEDRPKKRHRFLRFMAWMLLIVFLTGAGGGAAWYFWLRKEPKDTPPASQQEASPNQGNDKAAGDVAEPTNTFNSAPFNLQFDYPETWKAGAGADNKIVATSPATKLKLVSGTTQTGQIILTIQHKQISLPAFTTGSALAIRESEKIDYKKPSQVQRASTYLSFLNYVGSTAKGIDGVYITGDFGYVKDQYVPKLM